MHDKKDYIAISRADLAALIKNYCIANYSVMLFAQLAEIRKLEIHLSTDDVCSLLDVTRLELEQFRTQGRIKTFDLGGVRFYSAFDMARMAERKHRPERMRILEGLQTFDFEKFRREDL